MGKITSEESFQKLLLGGDWELVTNTGREFLVCTTDIGTFTFVPMFYHPGRPVTAWQWRDSRLPAGSDLCAVDDAAIIDVLNRGLQAALKQRAQEAEAKAAERAARALDDSDIYTAIQQVGPQRLVRVVVGRIGNPNDFQTFDPAGFEVARVPKGFFPAGIIYLGQDTQGFRVGRKVFRGVDETSAFQTLAAAENVAVRKTTRLNRTEQAIEIKRGTFFG